MKIDDELLKNRFCMKNISGFVFIALALGILWVSGCTVKYVQKEHPHSITVAVLPMENETVNIDGPVLLRERLQKKLSCKPGYAAVPIEEVDVKLREIGITDGGQLRTVSPRELGEKLNADAVIYGKLLVFNTLRRRINIGKLAIGDTIRAQFRMVDVKTGTVLWENEKGIVTTEGYKNRERNKAKEKEKEKEKPLVSFDFAGALFEKIIGRPLNEETEELAIIMVKDMPAR
ncbi:MAG: hypothetical protein A2297_02480 [Elusimicrobia bacterium RIFOXYB2_FULL_48_7]|nr:MAG: hypothetical protein A2297_02480 [Elusimicrobia bacterium RIFOXYB2_FULL_48_7]